MITAYLVCLTLGGLLVALSALSGLGKDVDHGDHDVAGDALHAHAIAADLAVVGGTRQETRGPRARGRSAPRWVPLQSVRFWTFGACFFGLTGVALSHFTTWSEAAVGLASAGVGGAVGSTAA